MFTVDTQPKMLYTSKISTNRPIFGPSEQLNENLPIFRAASGPKHWHTRRCVDCEQNLSASRDFETVALNRRSDVMVSRFRCRECHARLRVEWASDPLYSDDLARFWREYMPGLRSGAYDRGILIAINADDALALYLKQRGCCALSGLELDFRMRGKPGRANKAHLRPSVDRIDSNGNYTPENIQIVAQAINLMKGALPQTSFIEICGAIARHNLSL